MNGTKKGLLVAGSILGIVLSVIMIFSSFVLVAANRLVNEELIVNTYLQDTTIYAEKIELENGQYVIQYEEEGEILQISKQDIQTMVKISKFIINVLSISLLGFSVAMFVLSILILNNASKGKSKKGLIIALIVVSALSSNLVAMGLLIAALCIKDKKPTLENIDQIANEHKID